MLVKEQGGGVIHSASYSACPSCRTLPVRFKQVLDHDCPPFASGIYLVTVGMHRVWSDVTSYLPNSRQFLNSRKKLRKKTGASS